MSIHRTKRFIGLAITIVAILSSVTLLMRYVEISPQSLSPADTSSETTSYTPVDAASVQKWQAAQGAAQMPASAEDYIQAAPVSGQDAQPETSANASPGKLEQALLVADIAVEADYEYFAKTFKGNLVRATDYVTKLLSAVSAIYERDLNIKLRPSFVRIAIHSKDPWKATDSNTTLLEVKDFWVNREASRPRAAVLFLSGRNLGGGMAYRSGLCSKDFGYAVVSSVRGSFTTTPSDNTWDLISVAHELGHIFGSKHSHCYKREGEQAGWYDQCFSTQDTSGCYSGPVRPTNGTIMSYCYVAGGSMSRINPISFSDGDPVMVSIMRHTAETMLIDNPGGCMDFANGQMPLAGGK